MVPKNTNSQGLDKEPKLPNKVMSSAELVKLTSWIKAEAKRLGFSACGVARPDTRGQLEHLKNYLAKGYEGNMQFLHDNHDKRADPTLLVENTQSIISVRLDYLASKPKPRAVTDALLPNQAIIARYARGRDYHKTMRGLLKKLAKNIEQHLQEIGLDSDFTWRPFADSAPIFEKVLAENAGLGWTGKHTLLINRQAGSFFVLGELFTSLPLPFDSPDVRIKPTRKQNNKPDERIESVDTTQLVMDKPSNHCGSCTACIDICPTQAIVEPYQLNATRCIAYQTIENKGTIPVELRAAIGNHVFGCDDCQLICPWNGFAKLAILDDFKPRHSLDDISLVALWQWSEQAFLKKTEGSPLRRTGYFAFMRNVAIGLGNAPFSQEIIEQLTQRKSDFDDMVAEHIDWAIAEQRSKSGA